MWIEFAFVVRQNHGSVDVESLQSLSSRNIHQRQEPKIFLRFLLRKPDKRLPDRSQLTLSWFLVELAPDFFLTILLQEETEGGADLLLVFEVCDDNVVDGEDGVDLDEVSSPVPFVFRPCPDELTLLLVHRTPEGNREGEFFELENEKVPKILRAKHALKRGPGIIFLT